MFTFKIPNTDPFVDTGMLLALYLLQEVLRWSVENVKTIALLGLILSWLQIQAYKTKTVTDDKIITYLKQALTFQWVVKLIAWIASFRSKKIPVNKPGVVTGPTISDTPAVNLEVKNDGSGYQPIVTGLGELPKTE